MREGELERAADLYRQSIELREQLLAADANNIGIQRSLVVSYGNYGGVLGIPWLPNLGRVEEARAMCNKAVAIARRLRNADPQDATARIDLGVSLSHLGSIDPGSDGAAASLAALREAIELLGPAYKSNPTSSSIAGHISLAREYAGHRLQELGRIAEAEA